MAPEVVQWGEYNKKIKKDPKDKKDKPPGYGKECDIWSAGVLLYALIYGVLPFRGITIREIKEKILKGNVIYKDEPGVSDLTKDLIKKMLCYDPSERISIEEIL